ncbi:MAG: alanine/glycine:cation symporter family protein [Planctomycetota bacterium]|nr:alanine/glycine:cation symporter family protein [Planctomycetota bacterium]
MRKLPLLRALSLAIVALLLPPTVLAQETESTEPAAEVAAEPEAEPKSELQVWFEEIAVGQFDSQAFVAPAAKKVAGEEKEKTIEEKIDGAMGSALSVIGAVFFYDLGGNTSVLDLTEADLASKESLTAAMGRATALATEDGINTGNSKVTLSTAGDFPTISVYSSGIPLAVLWLVLGAIFFTIRMGFIQLRALRHSIAVTRGKFDNPDDEGEVSHFQALTAALSATVGLGNIAGVAIAISIGGPGATVWMIFAGFLGMASKFTECTLGQMYRKQRPDGHVMGGAMYYLSDGFKEMGFGGLGRFLAVFFAILCVGGSLAGGNSFQVNQSLGALSETFDFFNKDAGNNWIYGLVMTTMVAAVILGGLKRIAQTAEKIVPTMCAIYVAACMFVIFASYDQVPNALSTIITGAFNPAAGFGGAIGVLVVGFKRAAFSNEAGVGSAAIAHSAAKTEYPVREGIVALLEPLIDTIVICTMTALVIVITGAYSPETANGLFADNLKDANGAALTSQAFGSVISWFPFVLSIAVVLFAFSTMISWSYYGERCWVWLFGESSSIFYKIMFLVACFLGSITSATNVLNFGDLMILGMAFPNVFGLIFLSGKAKHALNEYWAKYQAGEFPVVEKE